MGRKGPEAFRTIAEAAAEVGVAAHVLRFWESQFSFVHPLRRAGGRRFYRPSDIATLRDLRRMLHDERLSIRQVQALPRRRSPSTFAVPTSNGRGPEPGVRPPLDLVTALDRAIQAKQALDRLLGSSTA